MPSTVNVNNMTVVHAQSSGITTIFPDTCKTPTPAGPVPIPYPNIAMSSDTAQGSSTVKMDGQPVLIKSSNFSMSTGDEAGSAQGVASNKIKGKAHPKMYSMDVKADGENVVRLSDILLQNGDPPTNTPPGTLVQPPLPPAMPKDPEEPKIKKIEWSPAEACCGDEVKLEVETEKFEDGWITAVAAEQLAGKKAQVAVLQCEIKGNKCSLPWVCKRGPWTAEVKLKANGTGAGGPKEGGNQLLVKTPADKAKETKGPAPMDSAQVIQTMDGAGNPMFNTQLVQAGEYCYDIEYKVGEVVVTRKLDFNLVGGAVLSNKNKKRIKRDIESVFDRKFRIHRNDCKRGDECECKAGGRGCCTFPIRIKVAWGGGHGRKINLNKGTNNPDRDAAIAAGHGWWTSADWWEGKTPNVPENVRAHEFGHLIDLPDEYVQLYGCLDPFDSAGLTGAALVNKYDAMQDSVMAFGREVAPRHMRKFHNWFHQHANGVVGATKVLPM